MADKKAKPLHWKKWISPSKSTPNNILLLARSHLVGSTTFQNTATTWEPSLQTHEPVNDNLYSNHSKLSIHSKGNRATECSRVVSKLLNSSFEECRSDSISEEFCVHSLSLSSLSLCLCFYLCGCVYPALSNSKKEGFILVCSPPWRERYGSRIR